MAAIPAPARESNLLLTLPPELRNVIYALVITTDYYELDPTISAKSFPRARYQIFGIQRGIKAQGGTPAIAQTCREIRIESLDVYYGKNTFALVGDDAGSAAIKNCALENRVTANEWMQLIGEDAKYLRKVRLSLEAEDRRERFLINYLVSVVPNESGDTPIVTALPGMRNQSVPYEVIATHTRHLESVIQKHLSETENMGKVWKAVVERALYPTDLRSKNGFDISEKGIAEARAKAPPIKTKSATKRNIPTESYQIPSRKPRASNEPAKPSRKPEGSKEPAGPGREVMASKQPAKPDYDSDCMEIEAPAKKSKTSKLASKANSNDDDTMDSDVMEIEAPAKKPKAAKKASKTKQSGVGMQEMMKMPVQKLKDPQQELDAVQKGQDENPDVMEMDAPVKQKSTTNARTAENDSEAANAEVHTAESDPKPATRASTRRKTPRKL